jgi:hypothetical protein
MSTTFDYDVFLSYSTKDKEVVHDLAERLRNDGVRVWLDVWVIQPGDSIPLKIQQGIEQSRTLLMCMSPHYIESEWGKLEHYSLLFRDPTNTQRRFIPVLIADCEPPDIIAQFLYVDWRLPTDAAYEKLRAVSRDRDIQLSKSTSLKNSTGRSIAKTFRENQDVLEKMNLLLQKYEFDKVEISDWNEVDEEEVF